MLIGVQFKPLFAKNYQFSIKFIRVKWSQFSIIEPRTAHDLILVMLEINPVLRTKRLIFE